jgi:hypothetical protein
VLGSIIESSFVLMVSSVLRTELGRLLVNVPVIVRSAPQKYATQAIEAPDNNRPPQFAEYLLYFLPKTMREPLLGDLEQEYHELFTRFGKRKATIWYYVQVALSYWPLLCSGVRKLIKWGVLGWIGSRLK